MGRESKWQTFEEWESYGIEHQLHLRNAKSISTGKDKGASSWLRKGYSKGWIKNFHFENARKNVRKNWSDYNEWNSYGIEHGFKDRTANSISSSDDFTERSWYILGRDKKWLKKFGFKRRSSWRNYKEWEQYGIDNDFIQRNPRSLEKSEDKDEKSWYRKGMRQGWLRDFKFDRKINHELRPWDTFDDWEEYGISQGYEDRNKMSILRSSNKSERSWYNKGYENGWIESFNFAKPGGVSNHGEINQLENMLEDYAGGVNGN